MEDLQPITDADQAAFCVELAKRLNMLRRQDCLCDITLITKDDKEFKAHRNILSAASPFFCKLLQSDMKENREGIVRFKEISGCCNGRCFGVHLHRNCRDNSRELQGSYRCSELSSHSGFEKRFWAISGTGNIKIKIAFQYFISQRNTSATN